jgi:membrane protease YdiL (CAAX protease family)
MKQHSSKQLFLLILPFLLSPSTILVFVPISRRLNPELGYVLGFLFYWIVWCILVPLFILKIEGIVSLFREESPLFQKSNWMPAVLLVIVIVITIIMYPPIRLLTTPVNLLVVMIPVAMVNGICEELLWRGMYVKYFPNNMFLGIVFPALGFACWHVSPQLVFPAKSGILPFVVSTFFLGISYGWISYRTKSIKWNSISHCIGGILALTHSIAPSILVLLSK